MILKHDIRLATLADAARIGEMSRDLIEHGLGWRWTPNSIRRCIRDPSMNVAVAATAHGGVAGFAVMRYKDDEAHLILLGVESEKWRRDVAGTLFADQRPRVVEIKGIKIDAELGPNMLYVTNEDKPGFIGRLGTLLGDHKVNIATFALGRSAPGQDAIALVEIDGAMPNHLIDEVQALPGVKQAKALNF